MAGQADAEGYCLDLSYEDMNELLVATGYVGFVYNVPTADGGDQSTEGTPQPTRLGEAGETPISAA